MTLCNSLTKFLSQSEYFKEWKENEIGGKNLTVGISRKQSFSKHYFSMVNKSVLVSSRFVCATVIQVNNRSRYAAAVFTSLYVIVSTTSQFVNDELIIKMWMANMSTSYYLISDRLRLHTEWVSLSLGLQRWGKIFSELLLFTWFFAAITFRIELVKEWLVINPKIACICRFDLVDILPNDKHVIQKQLKFRLSEKHTKIWAFFLTLSTLT